MSFSLNNPFNSADAVPSAGTPMTAAPLSSTPISSEKNIRPSPILTDKQPLAAPFQENKPGLVSAKSSPNASPKAVYAPHEFFTKQEEMIAARNMLVDLILPLKPLDGSSGDYDISIDNQVKFDTWNLNNAFHDALITEIEDIQSDAHTTREIGNRNAAFYARKITSTLMARYGIITDLEIPSTSQIIPPKTVVPPPSPPSDNEFFDVSPTEAVPAAVDPPPATVAPSLWKKLTTINVSHEPVSLASEDRNLLRRAIDAANSGVKKIEDTANNVITKMPSAIGDGFSIAADKLKAGAKDIWNHASLAKLPKEIHDFLLMFLEVLPLAVCDDPTVWVLSQPRLLYQYGFLSAAILNGVAAFVQQILKRTLLARDQGEKEDKEKELNDDVTYFSISSLVSAVHYYTVGWLPDFIPKDLIKGMVALNVAFTLGRNLEHFAEFILKMLRMAIDAVWWLFTGRPWFSQHQKKCLDEVTAMMSLIADVMRDPKPNPTSITVAKELVITCNTLYANALAADIKLDVLAPFKAQTNSLDVWIATYASRAETGNPRGMSTIFGFNGESSVGKTTLFKLVCAALTKKKGYKGTLADLMVIHQQNVNFQAALQPNAKFLLIDDAFLMVDSASHKVTLNYLGTLGSATPILRDNPIAPKKGQDFEHFAFVGVNNNITPNMPVNANEPIPRRFIGGDHIVTLNPNYAKANKATHLDVSKLPKECKTKADEALLNSVWDIVDHEGVQRNFCSFVDMLDAVDNNVAARTRELNTLVSSISDNYVGGHVPVVISPPPSKFNTLKPSQFPAGKPTGAVSTSNTEFRYKRKARDQTLVNKDNQTELDKWLSNPNWSSERQAAFSKRIMPYMKGVQNRYHFEKGVMQRDGVVIQAQTLWNEFVLPEATATLDIRVHPDKWTHAIIQEMKRYEYHIKGECCRFNDFCYRHGYQPCQSWDPDAVKLNHIGLAHWVVNNADLKPPQFAYFNMIGSVYSPLEETTTARILRICLISIASVSTGLLILQLINSIMTTFFIAKKTRDQSGYEANGLKKAPANTQKKLQLTSLVKAANQSEADAPGSLNFQWLLNKVRDNIIPMHTVSPIVGGRQCQMVRVVGNLAFTVRHVFDQGVNSIDIGGLIAATYPLRHCTHPNQFLENTATVQVWFDEIMDLTVMILPKSLVSCKDIQKFFTTVDTPVTALTGLVVARKPIVPFPIEDGKIEPSRPVELTPFPLGDADCVRHYESSANMKGLAVHYVTPTADGDCGNLMFTTNHRVGRGTAIIPGFVCAINDVGVKRVFAVCLTQETIKAVIDACPPKVLSFVRMQSLPDFAPNTTPFVPNVVVLGELPKEDTQYINHHNSIKPSLIHEALRGFEYDHPSTGEHRVIGDMKVAPSPIWQRTEPFLKYKKHDHVPKPEVFEAYKRAGKEVEEQIRKFADPKLFIPRQSLWSVKEALNGIPELNIPKLDWRKSLGYPPTKMLKKFRKATLDIDPDGQMDLKPQFRFLLDNLIHDILNKKMTWVRAVAALKEELRKIGKNARVVTTFPFLVTIAVRMFTLTIPSMLITGRIANGMALGSDMDGIDGQTKFAADYDFDNRVDLDADNYDASKSSAYSSVSEDVSINLGLTVMPFLDWDQMSIPVRWSRICLLIVSRIVMYIVHGMLSGHVLTTPLNCSDSLSLALTAWRSCKPTDFEGNDLSDHFFTATSTVVYGDDTQSKSNAPQFTNFVVRDISEKLGHKHGPGAKGTEMQPFTPENQAFFLKRLAWQDVNGKIHSPLDPDTIEHIHAFVRGKTVDERADTTVIAMSALQEWAKLGRDTFERVKFRLNAALIQAKCQPIAYAYEDYYKTWTTNHGITPITGVRNQSASTDPKNVSMPASSTEPLGNTTTTAVINTDSLAKAPVSGIVTTKKLTSIVTDAVVSTTVLAPGASAVPHGLDPYPPSGVDPLLGREYPIYQGAWNTADPFGTRYTELDLMDEMIAIPKLAETLSRLKYIEADLQVSVSCAGSQFAGGGLRFTHIVRDGDSAWRSNYDICCNTKNWVLSAGEENTITFQIPWCSNRTGFDIQTMTPASVFGKLIIDVAAQLSWCFADPPTNIPYVVRCAFVRPKTSGFDVNVAPVPPSILKKRAKAAKVDNEQIAQYISDYGRNQFAADLVRYFQTTGNVDIAGLRNFIEREKHSGSDPEELTLAHTSSAPPITGARNQSASSEAANKASSGVLDGVASAVKTVMGGVEALGPLAELALFDKPYENASVAPVRLTSGNDTPHTRGVMQSTFLAARPMAYVMAGNKMMAEKNPIPVWDEILTIPGMIEFVEIPAGVTAGTVVYGTKIYPCLAKQTQIADAYVPTPLCWWAMQHEYFHGDMKMAVVFYSPKAQSATFRISYFPTNRVSTVVADNEVGDVRSREVTIVGFTVVPMPLEYLHNYMQLPVGDPANSPADPRTMGSVTVQCTRKIIAPSDDVRAMISMEIWVAADKGMVLSGQKSFNEAWEPSIAPAFPVWKHGKEAVRKKFDIRKTVWTAMQTDKIIRAKDQSCMRDFFGSDFPPITTSSPKTHKGICDPDRTSGPIEILKRWSTELGNIATPVFTNPFPDFGTFPYWATLPWAFWSGSFSRRFYLFGDAFPGTGQLLTSRYFGNPVGPTNGTAIEFANGAIFTDLSKEPFQSVAIPFNTMWPAYEVDVVNDDESDLLYMTQYKGPGGAANISSMWAAGDDFAVYMFHACPYLLALPVADKSSSKPTSKSWQGSATPKNLRI
jgi:hypothetical protein